jgi:hypothetical protein
MVTPIASGLGMSERIRSKGGAVIGRVAKIRDAALVHATT